MKGVPSTKKSYIKSKVKLLTEFSVEVTQDIIDHMSSLYPNEIAIENYVHDIVVAKLYEWDEANRSTKPLNKKRES